MPDGQKILPRTYAQAFAVLSGPLTLSVTTTPVTKATATGRMGGHVTVVSAAADTFAAASGAMSGRACQVSGQMQMLSSASGAMTGRICYVFADSATKLTADGSLLGKVTTVSAESVTYAEAAGNMAGRILWLTAEAIIRSSATATLTGASDTHGMSICDVVSHTLSMWGIFCRKTAPAYAIARAIADVNSAMQIVWNNAEGRTYWTNATLTLTLNDGESSTTLSNDVQNVVGPCRLESNRQPLVPIGTIGELETFSDAYLDSEVTDVPVAYHIERMNQSGADPAKCVFHVNQAIVGDPVSFLLEVVNEPPRFAASDLTSCPIIPIPHRYVESLLLPIARYLASTFYMFRMADQKPTIDREYQHAMSLLGLADPINPHTGDNKQPKEKGATAQ